MKRKEWEKLNAKEQKKRIINRIKNAVGLDIHSNVCYLLNFYGMSQEMADELSEHYNAINKIISDFEEQEIEK